MSRPLSEFGRALKELEVEIIHAYSPQAKGRIERLFGTLQDRLVKELRLRGISAIDEANKFLDNYYLREFNRKFSIKSLNKEDLHRPIPKWIDLKKNTLHKDGAHSKERLYNLAQWQTLSDSRSHHKQESNHRGAHKRDNEDNT